MLEADRTEKLKSIKSLTGKMGEAHIEEIPFSGDFLDMAAPYSDSPGTVLLMSGGDLDCARYHILGIHPWLTMTGRGNQMTLETMLSKIRIEADPLDFCRIVLKAFSSLYGNLPGPITAGLLGYLAYDLKDLIETLPRTSVDDLGLPHLYLYAPSIIIIHDKLNHRTWACLSGPERIMKKRAMAELELIKRSLLSKPPTRKGFAGTAQYSYSNIPKADYIDAIKRIQEYIAAGDVYQINMSQRFTVPFQGDAFGLFRALYEKNPAPFFAYVHCGDHRIISTSPERFIKRDGGRVESRPIKGTRPRGKTDSEDKRLSQELMDSRKDDAELSMIVDLLRNDIGKVCEGGTVRVAEHKRLEVYENVFHLISIVEGRMDQEKDSIDLIRATFPGGSITGCPKIRAMEIIDELEPHRRHVYTGSIGYISFHDTLDLSIAIRTATVLKDSLIFSVGGGVVYDSSPLDEFEETLHKGRTIMELLTEKSEFPNPSCLWMDGTLKSLETARISVMDLGVQYGYGLFETIRSDQGKPLFLEEHIRRLSKGWEQIFEREPPDLDWKEIIRQVIEKNRLTKNTGVVKIMVIRGTKETPPFDDHLIVTARPYKHRLAGKESHGIWMAIYPEPRQTPLADHKTLNYLYYYLAGKWAEREGCDEALILNPDGTISETNTANILCIKDRSLICPLSAHALPGVMMSIVGELLKEWGYEKISKAMDPGALFDMDEVWMTNSLIGAVPVLGINGNRLGKPSDLSRRLNEQLLFDVSV